MPDTDFPVHGFTESYLAFCRQQGRSITRRLTPRPGDWILHDDTLELVTTPGQTAARDAAVIPSPAHALELLRAEAAVVILDCQPDDTGCSVFDEMSRPLANVVASSPEECLLRALHFVRSERQSRDLQLHPR